MICCGVPRTLPSGPELSKTRLITLPVGRRLFWFLFRERDLFELLIFCVFSTRYGPVWEVFWQCSLNGLIIPRLLFESDQRARYQIQINHPLPKSYTVQM